jgi:hypothetical protein
MIHSDLSLNNKLLAELAQPCENIGNLQYLFIVAQELFIIEHLFALSNTKQLKNNRLHLGIPVVKF